MGNNKPGTEESNPSGHTPHQFVDPPAQDNNSGSYNIVNKHLKLCMTAQSDLLKGSNWSYSLSTPP